MWIMPPLPSLSHVSLLRGHGTGTHTHSLSLSRTHASKQFDPCIRAPVHSTRAQHTVHSPQSTAPRATSRPCQLDTIQLCCPKLDRNRSGFPGSSGT